MGTKAPGRKAHGARSWPVRTVVLLCALLVLAVARSGQAHPLDLAYLRIDVHGTSADTSLEINSLLAAHLLEVDAAAVDAAFVATHAERLAQATFRDGALSTDRGDCSFKDALATIEGQNLTLTGVATCPNDSRTLRWDFPFVRDARVSRTFEMLVRANAFGSEHLATIDANGSTLVIEGQRSHSFVEFVRSGIAHIGAAPSEWVGPGGLRLADGIDHILFLVGLILCGGTLWQVIGTATGFTVGHSVTLALASLGLLRPPARLIEPAIALTIAFVAIEVLGKKGERARWQIAAAFGLIHGFGFASALSELDLSGLDLAGALFGYNLGVELGQLAIVLLLAPPLVLLTQKAPRASGIVVQGLAALIFVAGSYWFVRRAFAI